MLRVLADENFNNIILRGVQAVIPDADILTVQWLGRASLPDPAVLELAAAQDRTLLSHDWRTMPGFAYERIAAGLPMTGLIIVPSTMAIGAAIHEIALIIACTQTRNWTDTISRLPL